MSCSLLCDAGNTAIKIWLLRNGEPCGSMCLPAVAQTPDSLGLAMRQAAQTAGLQSLGFSICMAASVVSRLDQVLEAAVRKYFNCATLFLGRDFEVPLESCYEPPSAVGADRLAAAYGARLAFPEAKSIVVVDFGTAVTFDCVTGNEYGGGLIFPGPEAAMTGLASCVPRLAGFSLDGEMARPLPGQSTESCLRNGFAYGYASLTQGLCNLLAANLADPVAFVATGGYAHSIIGLCSFFDRLIPNLVLEGLMALYRSQCS